MNVTMPSSALFPRAFAVVTHPQKDEDGHMTRCFVMLGKAVHVASTTGVKVGEHQHHIAPPPSLPLISLLIFASLPASPVIPLSHMHMCVWCICYTPCQLMSLNSTDDELFWVELVLRVTTSVGGKYSDASVEFGATVFSTRCFAHAAAFNRRSFLALTIYNACRRPPWTRLF